MTMNALRLRLARAIAPMGADVHNPDETACPSDRAVLEAAEDWALSLDGARVEADVTDAARYCEEVGWIEKVTDPEGNEMYRLTDAGAVALARVRGRAQ